MNGPGETSGRGDRRPRGSRNRVGRSTVGRSVVGTSAGEFVTSRACDLETTRRTTPEGETRRLRRVLSCLEDSRYGYERVVAAVWARQGAAYAEIGRRLGLNRKTAKRRVVDGEQLLRDDPDGARRLVDDYLHGLMPVEQAREVAAVLLSDDTAMIFEAAARLFESRGAP